MKRLLLLVSLSPLACQCFEPVEEVDAGFVRRDAGPDAGRADGGVSDGGPSDGGTVVRDAGRPDADAGHECVTAADCRATPWASRFCFFDAGFSCIDHRCVSECPPTGRTCFVDAGSECVECDVGAPLCLADTCPTSAFFGRISSVECRPDAGTPPIAIDDMISFVPVRGATCLLSATPLGQVVRSPLREEQYWFIRPLGGYCLGTQLPTGAIRSSVACPSCTFTIEGF